jgi:hypothetical protein
MARFTASINDQLKAQLDTFANENGYNRSEALELMIRTFFEGKAPPQSSSPSPLQEAPSEPPASQPDPTRLDELEARLELLQGQLRLSSPVNIRIDMIEMQTRLNRLEGFLFLQHGYLEDLHEVVGANVDACVEGFTALETPVEFFVTSSEPPALDWTESN